LLAAARRRVARNPEQGIAGVGYDHPDKKADDDPRHRHLL
jgi:hypothetical protein